MSRSPLTITLFGPFEVAVHGQPLRRLRSRSLEWLLALLVLRHGRPISRAVLAGTLWPASSHARALRNVRAGLLELRQALGPEAERLGSPTRDSLQLDLTEACVDLLRFDAAVAAADEGSLLEAVALYRGPLLEGCCEEWIVAERAARQEACLHALERLADLALARGDSEGAPPLPLRGVPSTHFVGTRLAPLGGSGRVDPPGGHPGPPGSAAGCPPGGRMGGPAAGAAALGYLHRAEILDPLRDSVQQRRMRALAASGDLPAALLSYREYRLRLHREMSLEPDPETTRLFRELQAGGAVKREGVRSEVHPITPSDITPSPPSPAPRVPALTPSRLPRPLASLIGRTEEVEELSRLLAASRLVTLLGGGGVGKTRLAFEVAAGLEGQYPGRVAFVELARLDDAALLPAFAAAALGLHESEAGPGAASLMETLSGWLFPQPTLLVLDNCEHLIEAAAALAQALLETCPELRILATSRQRLGLTGETAWRVRSLPAPDPERLPVETPAAVEHVLQFPAAQLFVTRAAATRPGFQLADREDALAVARVCRRLDGIPLALELAAARVTVLSLSQIAARLDDRFRLLTGGSRAALPRHQTLRALIDWSYDSLPEAEAALLRRLSVFADGWTLEAAEAVATGQWSVVCGVKDPDPELTTGRWPLATDVLDLLASLEGRSLVLTEESGQGLRYRMLETVREYAREKLAEEGEEAVARGQHLAYFLHLAEEAAPRLAGADPEPGLALIEAEIGNIRAALAWAPFATALPDAALRLTAALWPFWMVRGYLTEGREHLRATLQVPAPPDSAARAPALLGAARLAMVQFDLEAAQGLGRESLERFRARGSARGMADALLLLGQVALARADYATARALLTEAHQYGAQSCWTQGSLWTLAQLGGLARLQGDRAQARSLLQQGLALAEAEPAADAPTLAAALNGLGNLAYETGDTTRAVALLRRSLEISRRLGYKHAISMTLSLLGDIARRQGELTLALSYYEEAAALCREQGSRTHEASMLAGAGSVLYELGTYEPARAAYTESLALFRRGGGHGYIPIACNCLGSTLFHLGDPAGAAALHREALTIYHRLGPAEGITWSLERLGVTEARAGNARRAARLLGAASVIREGLGTSLPSWDQADWDQALTGLHARLEAGEFQAAWAEGQAMPVEQAVEYALAQGEGIGGDLVT